MSVTLAWNSAGAESCRANEAWGGGARPLLGEESITGPTAGSQTYTLTCANRYGENSAAVTVNVKPPPSLNFYSQPASVTPFQSFTLRWNSSGTASCTASGAWRGGKPVNGSQWMPGFRSGSRVYTLTCNNPSGSVTRSVTIAVQNGGDGGGGCPPGQICLPGPPVAQRQPMPGKPALGKAATQASAVTITRITYRLAGQPIAVRVSGDPAAANNGLHYLYADHLGGINAIQRQNGAVEQVRYYPFGGYRQGGRNPITDRAFTGQKENMADLGLYYYNARYYLPGVGRFLSADTIVPDPTSPQSLNRYTYVLNSPLNLSDPTGHCPNKITVCIIGSGGISQEWWDENVNKAIWNSDYYYEVVSYGLYTLNNTNKTTDLTQLQENWAQQDFSNPQPIVTPSDIARGYLNKHNGSSSDFPWESLANYTDTALDLYELFGGTQQLVPGSWLLPAVAQLDRDANKSLYPEERALRATTMVVEGYMTDSASIYLAKELGVKWQ